MRLLLVTTCLDIGGAEQQLLHMARYFINAGHEVAVVSLHGDGVLAPMFRDAGAKLLLLSAQRSRLPGAWRRLQKFCGEFRPDLVQGWMYYSNLFVSAPRVAVRSVPVVWGIRQSITSLQDQSRMSRVAIPLSARLSARPATIVYNSAVARGDHEKLGFRSDRGVVIPNGFAIAKAMPDAEALAQLRLDLGLPPTHRLLGHIARLHPMKDHETFLRAAIGLMRQEPNVSVLLVGRGVTSAADSLTALVPEEFRARVHFLGERQDVPMLLGLLDILVQSSWTEGFPNTVGEAMAAGIPCVATDVGDTGHLIGDTGRVVPPRDASALMRAVGELLSLSPEHRRQRGEAAKARIETMFSLASVAGRYLQLYDGLVTKTD